MRNGLINTYEEKGCMCFFSGLCNQDLLKQFLEIDYTKEDLEDFIFFTRRISELARKKTVYNSFIKKLKKKLIKKS